MSGNLDENWRIGLMDIQTRQDKNQSLAAENFGVVSLQRKLFDRSNLSILFVNKQALNLKENQNNTSEYNRNIGLEYNYFSADNLWNAKLLFLKSLSPVSQQQGEVDDEKVKEVMDELEKAIKQLKKEMQRAAKELDFILAASIRDQIIALEKLKDSFINFEFVKKNGIFVIELPLSNDYAKFRINILIFDPQMAPICVQSDDVIFFNCVFFLNSLT